MIRPQDVQAAWRAAWSMTDKSLPLFEWAPLKDQRDEVLCLCAIGVLEDRLIAWINQLGHLRLELLDLGAMNSHMAAYAREQVSLQVVEIQHRTSLIESIRKNGLPSWDGNDATTH